jgi:hypothetical protein
MATDEIIGGSLNSETTSIAPRKYRARHMHMSVNHGTVGARNEGATRA